ncbi:DUF3369 domain-containing protein [Pseudomarimonas arenosa]|uniref:DUF3369 domain-containing protein n=1 Tax=Pseudomarimonas arenosa TaxID=2774145 RepID=A0AAW3ZHZ2_9GAMM|nr:DUF3369 domain-containing protein [Pseudomarimonas arenosa]MBD8524560.1 DUF3369 domain-containing protein [Pseudomarimonas arenosa]
MSSVDSWLLDDPTEAPTGAHSPGWKVLVVDDEEEVHSVTQMVLQHFEFERRPLHLMHAYSGNEAVELIASNEDIALILLDVVMENDAAGLQAVKRIRDELGNRRVRIVLRTGQPGQAPEHEVIANYDINDYKDKTELTAQKLKTLLYAALRSYRDLVTIESNQRGLEKVIEATASVYEQRELQRFASAVLMQMTHLLQLRDDAVYLKAVPALIASTHEEHRLIIEAGSGDYQAYIAHEAENVLPPEVVADLREAIRQRNSVFKPDHYVLHYASSSGVQSVMYVGLDEPLDIFQQELLELFCANVSVAFENLHLNRDLEESQKEMVYLLGEAVECRSNETGSHVRRVADMSYFLAIQARLDPAAAELIRIASPMHDVGKVGIPDAILNKPGRLTEAEFEVMKTHATMGYEMLSRSNRRVFQVAARLARDHHEHWDGQGYPRGLSGADISIEGRITAIADVLDALLSVRCYKPAWPKDEVLKYFRDERGRKFDPDLTDIVLNQFDTLLEIRNRHLD